MAGPLSGVRVVEIGSIGPGPFTAMMLADMGADVVRLERGAGQALGSGAWNLTLRGRPSVAVNLKRPEAVELVLELCEQADVLIEGFRPGVMERLGLGPDIALARNPKLVYGRMTGYGQDGPMADVAGHDINYISIAGALGAFAREGERPLFPLNLVGDYGGGGMLLAFGVVCAVLEARSSGQGQVVDAAMVDGTAILTTLIQGMRTAGAWSDTAGTNMLDSGAPFYEVYETADGLYFSIGAIEPQFYVRLLELMEIPLEEFPQLDGKCWPALRARFTEVFKTKTRDQWTALLEPVDACATPVLGLGEAHSHRHNVQRKVFVEHHGVSQPAPAPRFSRTVPELTTPAREPGENTDEALSAWGVSTERLSALREAGAIG
jgi:alpha-methylacyl-CoA racemase